jgi:uncharacterized membrane protein
MCTVANGHSGYTLNTITILTFISISLTTTEVTLEGIVTLKDITDITTKIVTDIKHTAAATTAQAAARYQEVTEDQTLA